MVPWRADPAVLAGYLRLNLLNGSYVGHYLPQQAYIIDFAGEQLVVAMSVTACRSSDPTQGHRCASTPAMTRVSNVG